MIFDAASEDNRAHYELSGNFDDLVRSVCATARSSDVILTIGAGSVGTLGKKICETLEQVNKGDRVICRGIISKRPEYILRGVGGALQDV